MKHDGLATATFALIMGGAVALAIAGDITAPICKAAAAAVPKEKFDFGCLEFWLNRYQGLLGNIITAAVAGATLIWIARQFDTSDRQAATVAASALRARIEDLKAERKLLNRLRTLIPLTTVRLEEIETGLPMISLEHVRQNFALYAEQLDACNSEAETFSLSREDKLLFAPRNELFMRTLSLRGNLAIILRDIKSIQQSGNWVDGPLRTQIIKNLRLNREHIEHGIAALRHLDAGLKAEITGTWRTIRAFETHATRA